MCDLSPTANKVANLNQAETKCLLTAANCCHVPPTPSLHHVLTALIQWASWGPLRFSGIVPEWESSIFNFHFPPGSIFHHFHPYVGVGVPPLPSSLSFAFTYLYLTLSDLPLAFPFPPSSFSHPSLHFLSHLLSPGEPASPTSK